MISEIQSKLVSLSSSEDALFLQRFFKTGPGQYGAGDRFRGIRVPALRRLSRTYQDVSMEDAERLLHSAYHEDRLLALFILTRKYNASGETGKARIYRLYLANTRFINNWDLVDASAPYIVGAFLRDRRRAPLYKLARSRNMWERRIAILATFHFLRCNEVDDTIRIAGMLLNDREDLIQKAVGWMLREVGKRSLPELETFLMKHGREMPRTMLRYAIEKMPAEKRKSFLEGVFRSVNAGCKKEAEL